MEDDSVKILSDTLMEGIIINMAITKIKAIKNTLKKAIEYIANPDKTVDGTLVYSFGCSTNTADLEMALTAKQGSGNGNRIAYHIIQSFAPDDPVTPEKAFGIGKEFASKITNGRYEFVLTTHTDRNHIHNHIILNAVDFVEHKKYHYNMKEKYRIRSINDMLCKENNLSVIEKFSGRYGKSKYEYEKSKANESWKDKLCVAIDAAIKEAQSFDNFLEIMELEGYEIKRGKHIAFKAPGQERVTRSKRLGENYTEDAIRQRIENKENTIIIDSSTSHETAKDIKPINIESPVSSKPSQSKKKPFQQKRINLLVDIDKNLKAQQSMGYQQALVRNNINTLNRTMNFLIEHNLKTTEDYTGYADGIRAEYRLNLKSIKKIDDRLLDLSEKIKFTQNYKKYRSVYLESQKRKQNTEFYHEHEDEIVLYKASEIYFERKQLDPKSMNLHDLFEEYKSLKQEKSEIIKLNNPLKKSINELEIIEKNIATALDVELYKNSSTQKDDKMANDDITKKDKNSEREEI